MGPLKAAFGAEPRTFAEVRADRNRPGADQLAGAISDRRTVVREAAREGNRLGAFAMAFMAAPEQIAKGAMSVMPQGTPGREQVLGRSGFNPATAPLNVIGAMHGLFEGMTGR